MANPKTTLSARAQELRDKAKQLQNQAHRLEAVEATKARKLQERRKYIAGASILAAIKAGEFSEETLRGLVDKFHYRTSDRALFGLDPRG